MQLQPPQNPTNPPSYQMNQPNMVSFGHQDTEHHSQPQQGVKQGYPIPAMSRQVLVGEAGANRDDGNGDGKKTMETWHRVNWTDTMIRLLINTVYYIYEEWGSDANDPAGKKKSGGLSQKKGKWKSVSRVMMEKGYNVSPQQCEDKFNDLNKRYKRINDILGKDMACKVVGNQRLLDTMNLAPNLKEEAKKLLNSKHSFFKEMRAYHKCSGHDTGGTSGVAHHLLEMVGEPPRIQQQQGQLRHCLHSSENAARVHLAGRAEREQSKMANEGTSEGDDDNYDNDEFEDEDDDDYEEAEGGYNGRNGHWHGDDDNNKRSSEKMPRLRASSALPLSMQQFNCEATSVFQDGSKCTLKKKHWVQMQLLLLEEQQVKYQYQAFELEKQRLKWLKYRSKKEREMEQTRLENERRKLENERMVLILRQRVMELL